jgi:DNA-binding PadR family transcriptional regulator
MSNRELLEMTLLGLVGKFGPVTPYTVRQHFARSPTSRFSSSAGSIYPALERMESAGLVRSSADARGAQKRRLYRLTKAGKARLRGWFAAPGPPELEAPHDPLRTRLYFIEQLTKAQQRRFLDAALEGLEAQLREDRRYVRGYADEGPERLSRMVAEGGLALMRARLRWLRAVRAELLG